MRRTGRSLLPMVGAVVLFGFIAAVTHQPGIDNAVAQEGKPEDERIIHEKEGRPEGKPAVAGEDAAILSVKIIDPRTGQPIPSRVNVVGADGNFYEPKDNPLAPWSLHRLGNRQGKGPFRYYGWFFYTTGRFEVLVPPGQVTVEVWKGFEYAPATVRTAVTAGERSSINVELTQPVDMEGHGYYSGDTHLHLERLTPEHDERVLDLLQAEDVQYGFALCMNETNIYTGSMDRQTWPQSSIGKASVAVRGENMLLSGQEYRCGTYGHICLVGHRDLVLQGDTVDPNNWPVFGMVARQTSELGGYSFHAHGGYAKEIYADFAQQATSGVELLQFAEYRGITLQGWYHILNAGFRFPAVGASDYPYCRAFGDCRTYVRCETRPDPVQWLQAAAQGRSFFTTGPLLLLDVSGKQPGETLDLAKAPVPIKMTLRLHCPVSPVETVELLVNGQVVLRRQLSSDDPMQDWVTIEHDWMLLEPAWIAARAYSKTGELPNAEAHTNPVYVTIAGKGPRFGRDIRWLIERVQEQIAFHQRRQFAEKEQVLDYFRQSQRILKDLLSEAN